jgi:Zn-dependent protease with chaperone function
MPFLLMIFLTLVCLPEPQTWWPPLGVPSVLWSVCWTVLSVLLVGWYARYVNLQLVRSLLLEPGQRHAILRRYELRRVALQAFHLISYVVVLIIFGWGWAVGQFSLSPDSELPAAELLVLAPFLIGQFLCWNWDYDAERALHPLTATGVAGNHAADTGGTVRRGRLSWVLFQARQKLALVFLPVLLLILLKEGMRLVPQATLREFGGTVNFFACLALMVIFITLPWMVRVALGLQPLPDGPIRRRLIAASRRLGLRCSDLLLWNTRSGMANAMVIGIVPWVRYVVFTDRLLEEFSPDEVEAVFGHEVGHVKHQHMLYYFGFLMVSFAVLVGVGKVIGILIQECFGITLDLLPEKLQNFGSLAVLPMIGLMLSYIFLVFGFLSRRCERQADIFGCKAVSCGAPVCLGHRPDTPLPQGRLHLCPTGIHTFISALEKVAQVNGINRDRPGFLHSWQHSTIGRRVAFLQGLLSNPQVERDFQRRVLLMKWALFVTLGFALLLLYATSSM